MQGIKLTGFLFCYKTKPEMETVHKRLKDLKLPEADVKKSWNPVGVPYPWTVAVICTDQKRLDEVDGLLVEKNTDVGGADSYAGEPKILEFLRMLPLDGKYEPGIARIAAGECPRNGQSPVACQFCPVGHMLECHHPLSCEQANCSHLSRYMEE